ncbi:hypothetical protein [Tenacibaculum sp. SDUM215027]|uniref:hypothetical protein n=1 Tax=Tenacibaculum sp. SDUM215027 TaxID=3422596 RepID=UPI003D3124D0
MEENCLSFDLLEDIPFKDLISKMEKVFNISLPYKNQDGRLKAKGILNQHSIIVVDRHDDLADFLCDENHSLEFEILLNKDSEYKEIEKSIREIFKNKIEWKEAKWFPVNPGELPKKIYPDKGDPS